MSSEAVLAAGYAAFLLVAAGALEWLSVHTHNRSALPHRGASTTTPTTITGCVPKASTCGRSNSTTNGG